jgi:hypothetical protein
MRECVQSLLLFANSHMLMNLGNQVAFIASHTGCRLGKDDWLRSYLFELTVPPDEDETVLMFIYNCKSLMCSVVRNLNISLLLTSSFFDAIWIKMFFAVAFFTHRRMT